MDRRYLIGFFRIALVAILLTAGAYAAPQLRSVRGRVTDEGDKALKGAVVMLKNTRTLTVRSYVTRKDGTYRFAGLQPTGEYEITARYKGVTSSVKTLDRFDERKVAIIDIQVPTESK